MALADKLTLVPSAQYGVVYGRFVQGVGGPSLVSGVDEDPDAALSPVPGLRITFKPSTDLMISDPATQDSFAPTAYSAYTDGDGFFEISLLATDLANSSVENWYWEAEVYSQNPGNRAFRVGATTTLKGLEVKASSAVWLGDIITSQEASGDYVVQGKSAYKFAVEGGYEGTEGEFATALNASLDFPGVTTTMLSDGLASKADVGHVHPRLTLTGSGFPEGKVTADPGTQYFDTAKTCGATLWIKESGTGNTGWKLLKGDTGWRDINNLLIPEVARPGGGSYSNGGGTERNAVRRIGNAVHIALGISTPDTFSSGTAVLYVPKGFKRSPAGSPYTNSGYGGTTWLIYSNGEVRLYNSGSNAGIRGYWTFLCDDPWPTTLPGTPVY